MAITDPTDITGCVLWLDPDSITASDGDPIGTWSDSSGNGNDATASGVDRPTYRDATNFYHNNPSLEWEDAGMRLTVAADASLENAQVTYAIVVRQDDIRGTDGSGDPRWIFNKRNGNPSTIGLRATDDGVTNEGRYENFWRLDGSEGTVRTNASRGPQRQAWTVFLFRYDGSTGELYLDDDLSDSLSVAGGIDTDNTNSLIIGNHPTVDAGWLGHIAEVAVYDNAISNADRDDLLAYLLAKYPNSEYVKQSSVLSTGIRHARIRTATETGESTNQMLVVTTTGAINHYTSPVGDPHNWSLANSGVIATNASYRTLDFIVVSGTWYVYVDDATGFGDIRLFTGAAVTSLSEHGSSPIISGSAGDYQRTPGVIEESGSWTMLIDVRTNALTGGAGHIDRWTASDGVSWTKDTVNSPVLSPTGTGFEYSDVGHPHIYKIGSGNYLVAYAGYCNTHSLASAYFPHEIGLLTSTDLISFTRTNKNPAITHSDGASAWDQVFVANPCLFDDGTFLNLYYTGSTTGGTLQVGYAKGGVSNPNYRAVVQTMLSDSVTPLSFFEYPTNAFSFTSAVDLSSFFLLVADRLFFFGALAPDGQEATHNYVYEDVSNSFIFDNLSGYNQTLSIIQYLGFTDRQFYDCQNSLRLDLNQKVAESMVVSATNTFHFLRHDDPFYEALKQIYNVSNTMLTDSVVLFTEADAENFFSFVEVADMSATTFTRSPTHSVIKQHLTYSVSGSACPAEKTYSPFVGSSDDATYPAVSETPPTLGLGTVRFEYTPPLSSTITLLLRNPDFGNTDELLFSKVDRKTRGGDRKIFSELGLPSAQTLRFGVKNVCPADADEILSFLNQSRGKTINLFDWENRQWSGLIMTETEVFQDEAGTTFDIVFEGVLV